MKIKGILSLALVAVITLFSLTGCITIQPTATQQPNATQPPAATQQPVPTQQQPIGQQQPAGQQPPVGQQQPVTPQPPTIIVTDDADDADDGDVTATVTSSYGLSILEDETYCTGTIVVKVTNDTTADVEDIELELTIEADETLPDISSTHLTGGDITWALDDLDDTELVFTNSSGLDIDAGSYEKITLTLYVYFDDAAEDDIEFDPSVDVIDYN